MNRTKIDWADYTWNPITGCRRDCWFCYGKRIRQRFYPNISWTTLMWFDERLEQPLKVKKPSRIFVGSMSDIEYWRPVDISNVFDVIKKCPQHKFLFLTKNGDIYEKYDFLENCWLGVSSTNGKYRFRIQKNRIKFLSLEPLLERPKELWLNSLIDWLIIGGLTPKPIHRIEWIDEIIKEADRLKIPVFIKDNVHYSQKRQEYPNA